MQHLSKLLEIENSDLAWILRLSLHGLRASLQEALKKNTSDPGISACQELLQELNDFLELTSSKEEQSKKTISPSKKDSNWDEVFEPVLQLDHSPVSSPESDLKLSSLREAFIADPELHSYLGQFQLKSTADEDLWNEIQRLLLRVPAPVASAWRQRARELAQEAGASEDRRSLRALPFSRNQVIYPGLTKTVDAKGLCLLDKPRFDSRVMEETLESDLYFLAGVVSTYIKFIELDSSLHHALQSIDPFGVRSLESEQERSKYIAALIDCFQRAQAAEESSDPAIILRARFDLDEAIHSLVYNPPVDRDSSWWGKLQQEARHTLIAKARQYNVQIRQLWGPYADVRTWSKHDLELDTGGIRGEVSACLRVYAKINDTVFPGRVLFRSLR